jgi:hypothetical protein
MKSLCRAAFVLVVLVLPGAGCQRQAEGDRDVQVELKTEPDSPRVGKAVLRLLVTDGDGTPIEGATLKLEGNMAHAGMKPVFADATEEKGGSYRAEMEFTMGGDWFVLIDGQRADGRSFLKKIDIKGVKAD